MYESRKSDAQAEAFLEVGDPFSMEEVEVVVGKAPARWASAGLPRKATKSSGSPGLLVTWAVCNLVFACGVAPSAWVRVVAPPYTSARCV